MDDDFGDNDDGGAGSGGDADVSWGGQDRDFNVSYGKRVGDLCDGVGGVNIDGKR